MFARDTQQILTYLLTAWMFLTPILYAHSLLPPAFSGWMKVNPMTGLIAGVRDPLLWRDAAAVLPWPSLLVALVANYTAFLEPKVALISNIALMLLVLMWRPQGLYPVVKV